MFILNLHRAAFELVYLFVRLVVCLVGWLVGCFQVERCSCICVRNLSRLTVASIGEDEGGSSDCPEVGAGEVRLLAAAFIAWAKALGCGDKVVEAARLVDSGAGSRSCSVAVEVDAGAGSSGGGG